MKFQCDRCKTRYSIGEEKVRGKVLKIRCKNCSAVITVREGNASTSGPEGSSKDSGSQPALKDKGSTVGKAPTAANPNVPANGTGRGKAPVLEAAFDRAMARPSGAVAAQPAPAPLFPSDRGATTRDRTKKDDDDGDGATQMTPAPDVGTDIEWFVSIDGEQEGPFTLPEARKRVSKKKADEEMFAWQEGFEDWLPIDKVPELAPHLPAAKPPARPGAPAIPAASSKGVTPMAAKSGPAAAAAAPAAEESPFSLAALASSSPSAAAEASGDDLSEDGEPEKDNYDFDIGEASRVVKLPMLVPPPKGDAATPAPAAMRRTAAIGVQLPGMAAARGTGGQPIVGGQVVGSDVNIAAAVLQPRPRAKHGMFFFIGIGALLAVAGAMVWVLMAETKPRDFDSGPLAVGYSSEYIAQLYEQNPELEKKVQEIVPEILKPKPTGGKGTVRKTPKPGEVTQPGGTVPNRNYEEFGGTGGSGGPRQPEAILEKSRSEGGALKMCWERALKTNPELKQKGVRLEVNVNIRASGVLSNVNVASALADNQLKACVRDRVAAWKLPPASNDLAMQFPIVFQ